MEGIAGYMRIPQRKPWPSMAQNAASARSLLDNRSRILEGVPESKIREASDLLNDIVRLLGRLELSISEQNIEDVSANVAEILAGISELKLLQTPGLPFLIPRAYSDQPRLVGRAVVNLSIETKSGLRKELEIALDGYSSPLSAGVFAANVAERSLDDQVLSVDQDGIFLKFKNSVVSRPLPLEILPIGQFEPQYRTELEVQTGEVPVLPLSIFGSVSLSHSNEEDESSAPDEAFIFKFDRSTAGLGGMAFDEGKFSVIGYVTKGLEDIRGFKTGDRVVKAEIVKGKENLVLPEEQK